jgi:hypothetical protein
VALTLAQGRSKVRSRTRHVNDTTRLTVADLDSYLNDAHRQLRRWLRKYAPALYLLRSDEIEVGVADIIELTSVSADFEAIYKVEYLVGESWRPVEPADPIDYNQHQAGGPTYRREGDYLYIGPDVRDSYTVRALYYENPATIADPDEAFAVPECLERALEYDACSQVAAADQDDPALWLQLKDAELTAAIPALRTGSGSQQQRAGLRSVMGY